jgi:hypothetical protein
MDISLIITTYNWPQALKLTLQYHLYHKAIKKSGKDRLDLELLEIL